MQAALRRPSRAGQSNVVAQQASPAPQAPQRRRDFFVYPLNFTGGNAVVAGTAAQGAIQIQADSDFELTKFTMFADIGLANETESSRVLPLVTIQITDTGTGRALFSSPVPIPAIMGDGRIPFILPVPKIFSANASVAVQVANFSGATDYNLRLCLIGAKIFTY